MAKFLPRIEVKKPVSPHHPGKDGLLAWVGKELFPLLQQIRKVLNWAVIWLGLVQVDDADTPGTLSKKAVAGSGVQCTVVTDGNGDSTLVISAVAPYAGYTPGPPGIPGVPGADGLPGTPGAPGTGATGGTVTSSVASTLYPAKVPDAKLRTACRCTIFGPLVEHPAPGVFGFGTLWLPVAGISTWQVVVPGRLYGYDSYHVASVPLVNGDRVMLPSSTDSGENKYLGLYVVVQQGSDTVAGIIARAPDANTPATLCHSMVVQVTGGASVEHNGDYFTLTTSDPIVVDTTPLAFSVSSSYTSADKFELLTGPQLTSEGASNETLVMSWTMASGDARAPQGFQTLAGTPGLSVLPAGIWTANLPEVWIDDDTTGVTTFKWDIISDGPGTPTLFEIVSPPLSMSAVPMAPQYNQAADIPFSPLTLSNTRFSINPVINP